MNIITITREYGAGGGELARTLADALGWELLDRELLHQAAAVEHVPDAELERLDEKTLSIADRYRMHPPHEKYIHGLKAVVDQAAERGRAVLIGRGSRHLLGERHDALHLRLVAPKSWRARRMARLSGWTLEQAVARCTATDRVRDRFARYFFGDKAAQASEYDLIFNTGRIPLDDVAAVAEAIVRSVRSTGFSRNPDNAPPAAAAEPCALAPSNTSRRVLTLSRELGAGEQGLPVAIGQRLQLHVCDREMLEQDAVQLGVPEADLEKIDERGPSIFQRFRPGSLYHRYFEILGQLMRQWAERGNAVLVGRGGSRFLRDDPLAFHVHLIAPLSIRVRRVMEYHWVDESIAHNLIAQSDTRRKQFYGSCFGADWSNPLEYDLTVNSGRLGLPAVDAVAWAAECHWRRAEREHGPKSV